jgi:hypothetical protein
MLSPGDTLHRPSMAYSLSLIFARSYLLWYLGAIRSIGYLKPGREVIINDEASMDTGFDLVKTE